jgi:hypothetical protein
MVSGRRGCRRGGTEEPGKSGGLSNREEEREDKEENESLNR